MKILHLWKSDSASHGGGGAVAMYRLHSELRKNGLDSNILCEIKKTDSGSVYTLPSNGKIKKRLKRFSVVFF